MEIRQGRQDVVGVVRQSGNRRVSGHDHARAYHFQDGLGSVIALANVAGLVTETYAYTAFGKTVSNGTPTAAYRYTGQNSSIPVVSAAVADATG